MSVNGHNRTIKILTNTGNRELTSLLNGDLDPTRGYGETAYRPIKRISDEIRKSFWIPDEVNLVPDVRHYAELEEEERKAFDLTIGLLSTLDGPQTRLIANVANYIKEPTASKTASIIANFEAIHEESYSAILSSITNQKDQNRIFDDARVHPLIQKRNKPIMEAYNDFIMHPTPDSLIKALVQSMSLEGIGFYSSFYYFYALGRTGRMSGTTQIISFINRDELAHNQYCAIMLRYLLDELSIDNNALTDYVVDALKLATDLELEWQKEVISNVGFVDEVEVQDYVHYRANTMLRSLGLEEIYPNCGNEVVAQSWLAGFVDNNTSSLDGKAVQQAGNVKSDFFETRPTSYNRVSNANDFDDL